MFSSVRISCDQNGMTDEYGLAGDVVSINPLLNEERTWQKRI